MNMIGKIKDTNFNWSLILVLGWMLMLGMSAYERFRPASDWLVVDSVFVMDTTIGIPPTMHVDRHVKQSFEADWKVTVDRLLDTGRYTRVCFAGGSGDYSPDRDLPKLLDLDWWTFPTKCTPALPGKFRVTTLWTLHLGGGITKEVRQVSNEFNVTVGT